MTYPKMNGEPIGQIYVDQRTKNDAGSKIRFKYKTHAAFKGKLFKQPIYSPIDPEEEFDNCSLERLLLIHSNPFLVDRNSTYQYTRSKMVGKAKLKKRFLSDFYEVLKKLTSSFVGIVKGKEGSGKTLFAREMALYIKKRDKNKQYSDWDKHIPIYASQLNPIIEKHCFNNWRTILRSMLHDISKEVNTSKGELIEKLINESEANLNDKLFLIEEIFAIKLPKGYNKKEQSYPKYDPTSFAKKQIFPEEVTDSIIAFVVEFFKFYLNENTNIEISQTGNKSHKPPVVIFLDDSQKMDIDSWNLIDELQDSITKIVIYIIIRQNPEGKISFASKEVKTLYDSMVRNKAICAQYEIGELSPLELGGLTKTFNEMHQKEVDMEREDMIQLKNGKYTKEELISELKDQFIDFDIDSVDHSVLDTILSKTKGNALLSLQFMWSLLKGKYLERKDGIVKGTELFYRFQKLDDWVTVDIPELATQMNSMEIDEILRSTSEYIPDNNR